MLQWMLGVGDLINNFYCNHLWEQITPWQCECSQFFKTLKTFPWGFYPFCPSKWVIYASFNSYHRRANEQNTINQDNSLWFFFLLSNRLEKNCCAFNKWHLNFLDAYLRSLWKSRSLLKMCAFLFKFTARADFTTNKTQKSFSGETVDKK